MVVTETKPVAGVGSPRSGEGGFRDGVSEASSRSSRGKGGDRVVDGVGSREELCVPVEAWSRGDASVRIGERYERDRRDGREDSFPGAEPMGGLR